MAAAPPRMLFVSLPVRDLDASIRFFTALGFRFDPRITDETAAGMVVSDMAFVMLLREDRFRDFTEKTPIDPTTHIQAIIAVSAESRQAVDELAEAAHAAGAGPANEPMDHSFMYVRSFTDPDGHMWEVAWMDVSVLGDAPA